MKRYGLPRDRRLAKNSEFRTIIEGGVCSRDDTLVVYAATNDCGMERLGVTVGTRSGSAVVRNRLKRLIREAFRLSRSETGDGVDYVVMASAALSKRLSQCSSSSSAARLVGLERIKTSFVVLAAEAAVKLKNRPHAAKPHVTRPPRAGR